MWTCVLLLNYRHKAFLHIGNQSCVPSAESIDLNPARCFAEWRLIASLSFAVYACWFAEWAEVGHLQNVDGSSSWLGHFFRAEPNRHRQPVSLSCYFNCASIIASVSKFHRPPSLSINSYNLKIKMAYLHQLWPRLKSNLSRLYSYSCLLVHIVVCFFFALSHSFFVLVHRRSSWFIGGLHLCGADWHLLYKKHEAFPYIVNGSNPAFIQHRKQTHAIEVGMFLSVVSKTDWEVRQYLTWLVMITLMDKTPTLSVVNLWFKEKKKVSLHSSIVSKTSSVSDGRTDGPSDSTDSRCEWGYHHVLPLCSQ